MKRIVFGLMVLYVLGALLTACDWKKGEGNIVKADSEVTDSAKRLVARADSFKKVINKKDSIINDTTAAAPVAKQNAVYMSMWGHAGETGFLFDMDGTTGSYIPYDMDQGKEYGARRQLKLVSYDPDNGTCVINAYLKNKYIGQFKGKFIEDEIEMDDGGSHYVQAYGGVFTSVNGSKLDFSFYFD